MSDTPDDAGSVPANPEEWSAEGKRSVIFQFPPRPYRDIHYSCWRCQQPTVFTAEEQKQTFEVRKAYIWQRRTLCGDCHRERRECDRGVAECRRRWASEREGLRTDTGFLRRWLDRLENLPRYGGERDVANIAMLRRVISEVS